MASPFGDDNLDLPNVNGVDLMRLIKEKGVVPGSRLEQLVDDVVDRQEDAVLTAFDSYAGRTDT